MKKLTQDEVNVICDAHEIWLADKTKGARANFYKYDISGLYFSDRNLTDANMTEANMTRANMARANMTRANMTRANMTDVDMTRANMTDVDMTEANMTRANMTRANMTEANMHGCIGNSRQIKSIFISADYPITYTSTILQIGCKKFPISEWWDFNDAVIEGFEGGALALWKKHKGLIRQIIEDFPADPT